jgi:hypothetical protein
MHGYYLARYIAPAGRAACRQASAPSCTSLLCSPTASTAAVAVVVVTAAPLPATAGAAVYGIIAASIPCQPACKRPVCFESCSAHFSGRTQGSSREGSDVVVMGGVYVCFSRAQQRLITTSLSLAQMLSSSFCGSTHSSFPYLAGHRWLRTKRSSSGGIRL